MRIINSTVIGQVPQVDLRVSVTEQHTYDSGHVQEVNYLADPTLDFQAVADMRAANINAELVRREQALLAAANFAAPITVRDFLGLMPQETRLSLRGLSKTNAVMEDALEYLNAGPEVFKNVAEAWLANLVVSGVISQAVVDGILNEWTVRYG